MDALFASLEDRATVLPFSESRIPTEAPGAGQWISEMALRPADRAYRIAWCDPASEQNLAARLVPSQPEAPPSVDELRALAAAALPAYMLPAGLLMSSLPATSSGKLDRRALPDPRLLRQQARGA